MTIYNVKNSKSLFEKLAACEGAVEMVNENGQHILLTEGRETPDMSPLTYFQGKIQRLELVFQKPDDCRTIMNYLITK